MSVHDDSSVLDMDPDKEFSLSIPINNSMAGSDVSEVGPASAYVAGYILQKLNLSDCEECRSSLFSENITERHLFVTFKEYDDKTRLKYASDKLVEFVDIIHIELYNFLDQHGHKTDIENLFKSQFSNNFSAKFKFCSNHDCFTLILNKCVRLTIYKYLREKKINKTISDAHFKKIKKFKNK